MKQEIRPWFAMTIIALVLVAVGIFGWMALRIPTPNVTPGQTKPGIARQMNDLRTAMTQLQSRSGQGSK